MAQLNKHCSSRYVQGLKRGPSAVLGLGNTTKALHLPLKQQNHRWGGFVVKQKQSSGSMTP